MNFSYLKLLPLIILLIITIFVLIFLLSNKDPNKPPSALLNKDVPNFETVSLYNSSDVLNSKNLINKNVLINFFASWCTPCKIEHPLFFDLRETNPDLLIIGINHKDKQNDAKSYLETDGNPYNFVGVDLDGYIALEFGVFGLPETFIINKEGKIVYKFMGPLTKEIINNDIQPLL